MDPQSSGGFPAPSLTPHPPVTASAPPPAEGWAVPGGRGLAWWVDGWRIFKRAPFVWIGMTLLVIVLMFALALVPIIGQLASTLLYPVLGAGLLLAARAGDRGEPVGFGHVFACFDQRLGPLLISGALYLAGWFVVWLIAVAICAAVFGMDSITAIMRTDPGNLGAVATLGMFTLVLALIVLALGTPLMMAYWFAPALIALRGDRPLAALKASFHASMRNVPPLLIYGVLGVVFAVLASLPLLLGWFVLGPVFVASVYASYRDIYADG